MIKTHKVRNLLATPYLVWILIFILVPLAMIFWYGFTGEDGRFTLDNILAMAKPEHARSLWRALYLSVISTGLCLLLAYPLCLILAEKKTGKSGIIVMLFVLPMWMNFLLRTMAWQTILEKTGILNTILTALHLPTLNIINTQSAILFGMIYNFLPFMVLPLYNTLAKIDPNVISAARDLGADSLQTFRRIILPLSVPGILSGIAMVFIPSLTTFVISNLLGGSKILLIGNVIEQEFTLAYDWHLGSGLSIILMLFIIVNMVLSAVTDKNGEDLSL